MTAEEVRLDRAAFISKVYTWMAAALGITGLVAMATASSDALVNFMFGNTIVFWGLIIAELALVFGIGRAINKISSTVAIMLFLLYSALNGLTLSAIFLIYTTGSIASTFFITAGTFAAMSVYGYFTKRDLTSVGNIAFMALIGLIIASVVNIFWHNSVLYWITTFAGVLIFVALTAYDTQKIKEMHAAGLSGDAVQKGAIMGALALYLDFINLFLLLLRIFGSRD